MNTSIFSIGYDCNGDTLYLIKSGEKISLSSVEALFAIRYIAEWLSEKEINNKESKGE